MSEALIFASTNPQYDYRLFIVHENCKLRILVYTNCCFCFDIQNNFGTHHVLQMLRASKKDLPVPGNSSNIWKRLVNWSFICAKITNLCLFQKRLENIIGELQVNLFQKLAISAEHVLYQNCSSKQNKSNNLCTQHVLQVFWVYNFHEQWVIDLLSYLWVSWYKLKSFWQRLTCT